MDWDEPSSGSDSSPDLRENLENLSQKELGERINALNEEISRVQREIDKRQAHQARADQVFKS